MTRRWCNVCLRAGDHYTSDHPSAPLPFPSPGPSVPLKVVTDVIMAAHGEAASLPKSERQATAVLNALADAGCIVIHNHPLEPPLAVALRPQDVPPGPWRDLVAQRR